MATSRETPAGRRLRLTRAQLMMAGILALLLATWVVGLRAEHAPGPSINPLRASLSSSSSNSGNGSNAANATQDSQGNNGGGPKSCPPGHGGTNPAGHPDCAISGSSNGNHG